MAVCGFVSCVGMEFVVCVCVFFKGLYFYALVSDNMCVFIYTMCECVCVLR